MIQAVPEVLARIVARKREAPKPSPDVLARWRQEAETAMAGRRDFRRALLSRTPAIIAEIKKASPSKGVLTYDFDPPRSAAQYAAGGAAALSVLTDRDFFQGSFADLAAARGACILPVLRKDFTLSLADVTEAAAHGADAVLLIAAILESFQMREFAAAARAYDMTALVEVHNEAELENALAAGADVIGVNNRDLNTFSVSLETALRLAPIIPPHVLRISESGIHSAEDVRSLSAAGYHAFLVGEHLMTSMNPAAALRELVAA